MNIKFMNLIFSQLKEVWKSLTSYQKKVLVIYTILGLPWIPFSIFASFIAKSKGTKAWPDTVEERRGQVIMVLSTSLVMTVLLIIMGSLMAIFPPRQH